jgi:hypothetical protein
MHTPKIHGKIIPYSELNARAALGQALGEIRAQDDLTWADLGAALGVSGDQAANYADGSSGMSAVTFGRGKREWGSRFSGYFDRLCEREHRGDVDDRRGQSQILAAALALSIALEDGEISLAEIHKNRGTLENAADAIAALLGRIRIVG